jgi:hypothetical protein
MICGMSSLPQTLGRKLKLFQESDPFKQWWSLDELRFCKVCEHLFVGRDIRLVEDEQGQIAFRCPTLDCSGGWADWQYPELHL